MEQKNLKAFVYANEVCFDESAEQPVDVEFTLPDYCPEVSRILKCRAVSRIASKGINGGTATLDGVVCVTLIYRGTEGELASYEYQYPFSKSFELPADCASADLTATTRCEYINCRAVTGRKLDLHGAAVVNVKLIRRKSTEIIADIEDSCMELRRGIAPATMPMGYSEKHLIVDEELEIGQGQPAVRSILRYDLSAAVRDSKIVNGKVMVKGEICTDVLYTPEGTGAPQLFRAVTPYSQMVDVEGVSDECECDVRATVCYAEIRPRPSGDGESRVIMLNAKLLITVRAYCNNDVPVILDAYSRKHPASITKSEQRFEKITERISETFHCKKSIEFSEGALGSVTDLWCEAQTGAIAVDGNQLAIRGIVTACIIVADSAGELTYYERPIDFEYKYTLSREMGDLRCEPQIDIISAGYTLTGTSGMELRVDIGINAAVYEITVISLITDCQIDEKQTITKKSDGAMVVYFASGGERIWDIARKYSAGIDEIMEMNNLDSDLISEERMLLVPIT